MKATAIVDVGALRGEVRRHYAEVAAHPDRDFHFLTGRAAAEKVGYGNALLEGLPLGAVEAFAGVANPFYFGLPGAGERVVDIGCGAGMDTLIAAGAVGTRGEGTWRVTRRGLLRLDRSG